MKKRVLITGKSGFIANALREYIDRNAQDFSAELLDLRGEDWKTVSFENVGAIVHTAAIVHRDESGLTLDEYRRVNTELTAALAEKAKREGVPHFIFMSTMAVYGVKPSCFKQTEIGKARTPSPKSKYAISKFEAEEALRSMSDSAFSVAVVRPPIVYGRGCPGNYETLRKLTLRFGVIPKLRNKKSMIFIDNLAALICGLLRDGRAGTFMPQNVRPGSTHEMALLIAKNNGRKVLCTPIINPLIYLFSPIVPKLRKAFGSEFYSEELSTVEGIDYNVVSFEDSIARSEGRASEESPEIQR